MSEPHEHLEQAEHAEHHASDPFNQKVAVSMAIVAAILAGISMIGHRTHNEVLQLQGDSNRLRTEAATSEVEMSNLLAWYQAKKVRQTFYDVSSKVVDLMPSTDKTSSKKFSEEWKEKASEYEKSNEAKENLPDLLEKGREAKKKADKRKAESQTAEDEAKHVHHKADWIDAGHLLAEVALVLCSITLLTKKKLFWYAGLLAAAIAIGLTVVAYTIPREQHQPHHETQTHE
jgi:hypothetical protein